MIPISTAVPLPVEFLEKSDPLGGENQGEDIAIKLKEFEERDGINEGLASPPNPSGAPVPSSLDSNSSPIFIPPPKSDAPAFHNAELYRPNHELQKEEPHHRWICQLAAAGNSTADIAQMTGFVPATILNVKKQPWAQKYITELMERAGRKMVMNELCGHAGQAARLMIQSIDEKNPLNLAARDRVKAAQTFLDRCFGTAPATVISGKVNLDELSREELVHIVQGGGTLTT